VASEWNIVTAREEACYVILQDEPPSPFRRPRPEKMTRSDRLSLNRRAWMSSLAVCSCAPFLARTSDIGGRARRDRGAIVRGPRDRKHLALVFTGDRYAESAGPILDILRRRRIRAACFLTGRFLREPDFRRIVRRARDETDYREDADPRFVPADRIVASILRAERTDPDGLKGFLLLMHLGAGPRRTRDHLHDRLDNLLGRLADRGYAFVRVGELLGSEA
jgi:peptidoglycan/xylan/chitin deacetylase (PgdA/CDA1 family)